MEEPALTFAVLLRQLRAEARLTQEELAEAASLSPRSVSDLERGINRTARKAQPSTADMAAKLRRVIIAARIKAPRPDQLTLEEISVLRLAWEGLAA